MSRLIHGALFAGLLASPAAMADVCTARSGRNARAVTGCPSVGAIATLTEPAHDYRVPVPKDDNPQGSGLLAVDGQYPLGPLVTRLRFIVQDSTQTSANLALGFAWVHHFPRLSLSIDLGAEYTPPWADDFIQPRMLPTLTRYLAPDTQQMAGQFSFGYNGSGPIDLRGDADLVYAVPGRGHAYGIVQAGLTGSYSMSEKDFWGFRFGFDYVGIDGGPFAGQTFMAMPGAHVYSQYIDFGGGIGVAIRCPQGGECYGRPHIAIDIALPLGLLDLF
ncbi:MAG: hypothetical protein KC613_16430 [Myxococcales bacterium]|nr:hypothetical protein [Myxococcales bacterium]MCB9525436.1 hypothetical protein [Myxococcales bacterium]